MTKQQLAVLKEGDYLTSPKEIIDITNSRDSANNKTTPAVDVAANTPIWIVHISSQRTFVQAFVNDKRTKQRVRVILPTQFLLDNLQPLQKSKE